MPRSIPLKLKIAPPKDSRRAQRISLYVMSLILGGLITVGLFNLGRLIGPKSIEAGAIPFGLAPGTSITTGKGEADDTKLSPQALQEMARANDLLRAGNWKSAADVFGNVVVQFPQSRIALAGNIRALLQAEPFDESTSALAQELMSQLERKHPESTEGLFLRGLLASRQGQSTIALEFLEQAVKKNPGMLEGRLALGRVLLQGKQPLGAQTEARTGISLSEGSDGRFYGLLARSFHDEGRLDSCGQVVEYSLTRFPSDPELLVLGGMLLEYKGTFEQAEANYRKALAIDPRNQFAAEALHTLGEKAPPGSQGGQGSITPREKAQLAVNILEPLVELYPENMPLRDGLGQAYLKARQFDLALAQYQTIQDNDAEYPDLQLRIQESKAVTRAPVDEVALTVELKRGVDSLRSIAKHERSFSERLGHYLVRWGAPPKEFFAKYPPESFTRLDSLTWQETTWEPPLELKNTIVFDKSHGLSAIHVTVRDTSYRQGGHNVMYDLYGRLLGQNSRISGMGTSTGDTQCDTTSFQGAVWETPDNFEMMIQISKRRHEVRMVRLDRRQFVTMPRLCGHMGRLMQY